MQGENRQSTQSLPMGFAGLNSLISTVITNFEPFQVKTKSTGTAQNTIKTTSSNQTKQSVPPAAPSSKQANEPSGQTTVSSRSPVSSPSTTTTGSRDNTGIITFFVVAGIIAIVLIWANIDTTPKYSYPATKSTQQSYRPSQPPSTRQQAPAIPTTEGGFVEPPIGRGMTLTTSQIAWCLREEIKINAMRGVVSSYDNGEIDYFNDSVNYYNARCGNYKYRTSNMPAARQRASSVRYEVERQAKEEIKRHSTSRKQYSPGSTAFDYGGSTPSQGNKQQSPWGSTTPYYFESVTPQNVKPSGKPKSDSTELPQGTAENASPSNQKETVKKVQRLLSKLYAGITIDGKLGPMTRKAILDFQTSQNLPTTGDIITLELITRLEQAVAQKAGQQETKENLSGNSSGAVIPSKQQNRLKVSPQKKNDSIQQENTPASNLGGSIIRVQRMLNGLGYGLTLTGKLDDATRLAIHSYQRSRGLKQTGAPSRETIQKLESESRRK